MGENSEERPSARRTRHISAETRAPISRSSGVLVDRELTYSVIGCFFRVHGRLRDGYLEAVYVEAMRRELLRAGLEVQKEAVLDVWDRGERVGHYRADLLIEGRLIVEVKAGAILPSSARRQLINYLRCLDQELGLLVHFGPTARFHRVIHSRNEGRRPEPPR